jgi:50S ribosomal subunit-associated GTPase HflX
VRHEILKKLEGYIQASFSVPLTNATMSLVSWVHKGADVKKTDYTENSVRMVFEANPEFAEKVKNRVEELNGKFETNNKPQ